MRLRMAAFGRRCCAKIIDPSEKKFYFVSWLTVVFTLFQFENIDSVFTELTSHVTKMNKDLEELNNMTVLRKVKRLHRRCTLQTRLCLLSC